MILAIETLLDKDSLGGPPFNAKLLTCNFVSSTIKLNGVLMKMDDDFRW